MLESKGIKIFNFHPVHICLNTPTVAYYDKVKNKIYSGDGDDWRKYVYKGKGTRSFLIKLLENASANTGLKFMYLDDLYLAVNSVVEYEQASAQRKQSIVRNVYAKRDATNVYATSPDFNLRELEIDFIIKYVQLYAKKNPEKTLQISDIGCGNGYTDIRIAQVANAAIVGIDFSENMIDAANNLRTKFGRLQGRLSFHLTDATKFSYERESFDVIITERLLLNLPNPCAQERIIQTIHRLLKPNGMYIFVEGTLDGLKRLNKLRLSVGLDSIPDRSTANISSLKFHEKEIIPFLSKYFTIVKRQYFGMYFLISRVAHPLLTYPEEPRYDAAINQVARKISSVNPDYKHLGHIMGLILIKKVKER
jgi:ubiquinone/menaquinone biosynthesis C-methylase UbiE